jgi:hypothetical protein
MAVEQSIDQMRVAWATAPGANRQVTSQVRFRARCKCCGFLMARVDPLNVAAFTQCLCQSVQTVTDHAIYSLHSGGMQNFGEHVGDFRLHGASPGIMVANFVVFQRRRAAARARKALNKSSATDSNLAFFLACSMLLTAAARRWIYLGTWLPAQIFFERPKLREWSLAVLMHVTVLQDFRLTTAARDRQRLGRAMMH